VNQDLRIERKALSSIIEYFNVDLANFKSTYHGVVARSIMWCRIHEMIFDPQILPWQIPAPSNRLDDFQLSEESVRDIESGQLWTKSLCWGMSEEPIWGKKGGDLVPDIPPLLAKPVECTPFGII
jgi:hypothetical protein